MNFTEKTAIAAVIGGTAEALGGGKPACRSGNAGRFSNGAVTGAFVEAYNHLHDQITINRFAKKYFGHVEGLGKLYIDRVPEGYTLNEKASFTNSKGGPALAVTIYKGEGLSDVYLSPASMENAFTLYIVLGHEMIHVAHHNQFTAKHITAHSEFSAYTWSMAVHRNLFGKDRIYEKLEAKRLEYKQRESYNYDKFGFHSNIPRSLWDW
jgi:hypothetical protein